MRRILYLWLPGWAIDRRRRASRRKNSAASADEAPFATVIDAAGRRLLAAVNPAAVAAGLAPGMPLADALSFLPGLATAAAEPMEDAAALRRLAEWCGRYSPWTAPDGVDGVKIEIAGSAHLWGEETALAADLAARLSRQRIASRIAVADTLGAAWGLARFAEAGAGATIQPPGDRRAGLAPLPIEALRLDPATAQGLRRVGLKRIGELWAMPRAALVRRFGEEVARRLDQAEGSLPEPLSPLGETPVRWVRLSWPEPIAEPADLARATERLAADLVLRLALEGTGARRLDLAFYRVDGRVEHIRIGTARPNRDPYHLATLFKEKLDTVDPGLGVEDMILAAFAVEPLAAEQVRLSLSLSLSLSPHPNPPPHAGEGVGEGAGEGMGRGAEKGVGRGAGEGMEGGAAAASLLDRLGNRLALYRLEPHESHIPERASARVPISPATPHPIVPPPIPSPAGGGGLGWGWGPPRPIRLFAPPEPVEAFWLVPDDPPARFTWRRIAHRVRRADGPDRIAEEWWHGAGPDAADTIRDYYRVEDEEGRRFWLFRAGLAGNDPSPRWFIHGLFA
jgi:protein ImuB